MTAFLTSEVSACKAGYDNMFHKVTREVKYEDILSKTSIGAGYEVARGNFDGYER